MNTPPKVPLRDRIIKAIITMGGGLILSDAVSGLFGLNGLGMALVYAGFICTAAWLIWSTWNNPA